MNEVDVDDVSWVVFYFAQLHTELGLGKNNNTPSIDDNYSNRRATKTKNTLKFTNYDLRLASLHNVTIAY